MLIIFVLDWFQLLIKFCHLEFFLINTVLVCIYVCGEWNFLIPFCVFKLFWIREKKLRS